MILILLNDENSIINLDKFIHTQICQENVYKKPNDYEYTKQFSVNAIFKDGVVRRISPHYDSKKEAELFASYLFDKIYSKKDSYNILIYSQDIDSEVQERFHK